MHTFLLILLMLQALMEVWGAFWHHELQCALHRNSSARPELKIHAMRAILHGFLFIGLALFTWAGAALVLLWGLILAVVLLTLWDAVTEDRIRLLAPSERILHTVLAINGGALLGLLALLSLTGWIQQPTALVYAPQGWLSWALVVMGTGVMLSGMRDAMAYRSLGKHAALPPVAFIAPQAAPSSQHFLVTGGTGFIGQVLTQALLADGHRVTLWCRNPIRAAYLFQGRVASITSLDQLPPCTHVDVVINLAGEPIFDAAWTAKRRQSLLDSRVKTTKALARWLTQCTHKPRLMISGSAIGYYGTVLPNGAAPLNESAPAGGDFPASLCEQWEESARPVCQAGIPLAILRLGIVLGYQGGALPPLLRAARLGLGARLGDGQQIVPWVHIEDVIRAIGWCCQQAMHEPRVAIYNMVAPQIVTQEQFNRACARLYHRPAWLHIPASWMKASLGERADMLLKGVAISPENLLQQKFEFRYSQLAAALAQITQKELDTQAHTE